MAPGMPGWAVVAQEVLGDRTVRHLPKWLLNQHLILKIGNYGIELNLSCRDSFQQNHTTLVDEGTIFLQKNLGICTTTK